MKVRSIKINYLLNIFRVLSSALIIIATMPYINKILGAENVGKVEYVNAIINYFLLFSGLGIPMYGIREIAKVKETVVLRDKVVIELLVILGITTLISYLILFGVLYQLNFLDDYKDLILIMSSMILLTNIGAEWFFQGMEDQMYMTIRYVIVRVVALFLLFYFVRTTSDYLFYAIILVIMLTGSNVFNVLYLFKIIDFKAIKKEDLDFKRHLKPVITVFVAAISVNIYLQLDIFLIGSIAGNKFVGYYSVSNKLIRFIITFITVVGAVLLPRLTSLYQTNEAMYFSYLKQAFNYILIVSLPFSVLFYVFSDNIIQLMAGKEFEPSIVTMQILSPLCTIVGIAYFLGYLVLYPQNKEKIYTQAVLFSAIFSLLINYFVIKVYFQNGAAVIAVLSELLAIVMMYYLSYNDLKKLKLFDFNTVKILATTILMFFIALFIHDKFGNLNFILFITNSCLYFLCFFGVLKALNEDTVNELFKHIKAEGLKVIKYKFSK